MNRLILIAERNGRRIVWKCTDIRDVHERSSFFRNQGYKITTGGF